MNLNEFVEKLEVRERPTYTNISEIGIFNIFDIKNIEVKEFTDKNDPEKKYHKYLGNYGDKVVIIPLQVLEQLKALNESGFIKFNVNRTGSGLGTNYMVVPIRDV